MTSMFRGFVHPIFSSDFYQEVLSWRKRKIWTFVLLFVLVNVIIGTGIMAAKFVWQVGPQNLGQAKERLWEGTIGEITKIDFTYIGVKDGQLETDVAPQPYVSTYHAGSDVFLWAIDTTGTITSFPDNVDEAALVTKNSLILHGKSGEERTLALKDLFPEGFRYSKDEIVSKSGPVRKLYDRIWSFLWIIIIAFLLIIYPLVTGIFLVIELLAFVLIFGLIMSLLLPKSVKHGRFSQGMVLATFLFIPLHYFQTLVNWGIGLFPTAVSDSLCLFRFSWVLLAIIYIVFLILPSYRTKS